MRPKRNETKLSPVDFSFGWRVRTYREYRGLSLREFCKELRGDISNATLSRIERGHVPDVKTFLLLCKIVQIEPMKFFNEFTNI